MNLLKYFRDPALYVRVCAWSFAILVAAIALAKICPRITGGVLLASFFGFGLSFLLWFVPLVIAALERVWMKLLLSFFAAITGVVSSWMALGQVATVTGFPPGDYPSAVFALSVLLFVPAMTFVILVLGILLSYPAALLYWILKGLGCASTGLKKWVDALEENGGVRLAGWFGFLLSLSFVVGCGVEGPAKRSLDWSTKWIVREFEYHESPKHPWTRYKKSLHFHENGLVTMAIERGSDVSFEVDTAPPTRPEPDGKGSGNPENMCKQCPCCSQHAGEPINR